MIDRFDSSKIAAIRRVRLAAIRAMEACSGVPVPACLAGGAAALDSSTRRLLDGLPDLHRAALLRIFSSIEKHERMAAVPIRPAARRRDAIGLR